MEGSFTYATVQGKDMSDLIGKMEKVLIGQSQELVLMACLAVALAIEVPGIQGPMLAEGVRGLTEWIALFASSQEYVTEPGKVN